MSTVQYAALVGKYVRMERQPEEVEILDAQATGVWEEGYTVGAEGLVAVVYDSNSRVGGPCVEVVMDYGMGFPVFPGQDWKFHIWDSEATAKEMRA